MKSSRVIRFYSPIYLEDVLALVRIDGAVPLGLLPAAAAATSTFPLALPGLLAALLLLLEVRRVERTHVQRAGASLCVCVVR